MSCHPERTEPQTLFSSGVPKERSLLFGVEVGGDKSKDLLLHFGAYATNVRLTPLDVQVLNIQRIVFDELAALLYVLAH